MLLSQINDALSVRMTDIFLLGTPTLDATITTDIFQTASPVADLCHIIDGSGEQSGGGDGPTGRKGVHPMTTIFKPTDFESVEFQNGLDPRIKVRPMYFDLGFSEKPNIFGRQRVLEGIQQALTVIPPQYGVIVWDVYRCRATQGKLFEWMRGEIRRQYPDLDDAENYGMTRRYMSAPSKVGEEYCPPHLSGGAIDLTLFEVATGLELEMGTPFDDCTERAHSRHFDERNDLTSDEIIFRDRRNVLSTAMGAVGFKAYQFEWWHFDIGDIFWSRIVGIPAVFGPLFGDNEWPD